MSFRLRLIFFISITANVLAIPTMAVVISDFIYQANWRAEDQAAIAEDALQHLETRRVCGLRYYPM